MNFNIYLDDETGQLLNKVAKKSGKSRNALIRQAVREWLKRQGKPQWPEEVLAFKGMADMPLFEASRDRLRPPVADPLA
ncbi:MAG: CopG family transcriptional regulator [Zoogloea sp.]|nr:CopG family transcriptional regulator [Zoogloea sp.]